MGCQSARVGLLVIASLMTVAYAGAQSAPDGWYGRQAAPKNIDPPKAFPGMFSIELPKNWQLAPGHTGTIFASVEKTGRFESGALITVEYLQLQAPLKGPPGQFIVTRYTRPGLSGTDDHVVQYSFPIATTMYRLICIAPAAEVEKYRPLFAHVAASFTPLRPAGPG
jgi:hypothetical protein